MAAASETLGQVDPRVRRTKRMLHEALRRLLAEKDFDKISVQDIADAADLHRATFYMHYPDKFALLACTVGERFEELLARRGIRFDGCKGALRGLILGVCDYVASAPGGASGERSQLGAPVESAVIAVVRRMVMDGLRKHPPVSGMPAELAAAAISWAIFGAVKEWMGMPDRSPTEEIVEKIERLVAPIFLA